jgi:release factor glutamine methyltransferase
MATVQELLRAAARLTGESPRRDAEVLLCHCLGKPRSWLYTWPEREPEEQQQARYLELLARREAGEPVAHLTGTREFWSLQLAVDQHTLIPRPDTEILVEWALQLPLPEQPRVIDLGTGSGAIAMALASEQPSWNMTALDKSTAALAMASKNARALGLDAVRLLVSNWFDEVAGEQFDLIVSNPPYVAPADPHLERGDLPHEPLSALVAADEGLADLKQIVSLAPDYLAPGGWLLLEHGYDQGPAVREQLLQAGFRDVETRLDLAGLDRISGGCFYAD